MDRYPEGYWSAYRTYWGISDDVENKQTYEGRAQIAWYEAASSPVKKSDWYTIEICGASSCKSVLTLVDQVYGTNNPGMTAPSTTSAPDRANWTAQQQAFTTISIPVGLDGAQFTFKVGRGAATGATLVSDICLSYGETWAKPICEVPHRIDPSAINWSDPTPPINRYAEPAGKADETLPAMEILISHLNPDPAKKTRSISFTFCVNKVSEDQTSFFGNIPGFRVPYMRVIAPRAEWTLTSTNAPSRSGSTSDLVDKTSNFDADREPGAGRTFPARFCPKKYMQRHLFAPATTIDQLEPGRKYTLNLELESDNHPPMLSSVEFIVPGGCPTETLGTIPRAIPDKYVVIDDDRRYASWQMFVTDGLPSEWIGTRIAPLYYSPIKTTPTSSKFEYLPQIDDWALHLDATTIGNASIQSRTIFADCSPEEVQMLVEVKTNRLTGQEYESSCRLIEGEVQITRVGLCTLRVIISPELQPVKKASTQTHTADLYFIIDKLPTNPTSMSTSSTLRVLKNKRVFLTVGKTLTAKQIAALYKLSSKGAYTFAHSLPGSPCVITRGRVVPKRTGTCDLVIEERKSSSRYEIRVSVKRKS